MAGFDRKYHVIATLTTRSSLPALCNLGCLGRLIWPTTCRSPLARCFRAENRFATGFQHSGVGILKQTICESFMLVLSRKPGEQILIGEQVKVTVVRITPNSVRIGIEAPKEMVIVREELSDDDGEATPVQTTPSLPK